VDKPAIVQPAVLSSKFFTHRWL